MIAQKFEGGYRKLNYNRPIVDGKSIVSVVTVTFNNGKNIESTIRSVLNQDYTNIEYIIVDGASTDNTLQIIQSYNNSICYWISEKDNGVYDAMNKAIDLCSGDWIIFLNCGDYFVNNHVLSSIFKIDSVFTYDVLYGDAEYRYNSFKAVEQARQLNDLWKGMICSHQAMFTKLKVMKEVFFDKTYKFAADFKLVNDLFYSGKRFLHVDAVIISAEVGGLTESNILKSVKERKMIMSLRDNSIRIKFYYNLLIFSTNVKLISRHLLPKQLLNILLQIKNTYFNKNRTIIN